MQGIVVQQGQDNAGIGSAGLGYNVRNHQHIKIVEKLR